MTKSVMSLLPLSICTKDLKLHRCPDGRFGWKWSAWKLRLKVARWVVADLAV